MRLSEVLKELRISSGAPQSQIAKAAGVSTTQYQNYEYGKSEPTATVLVALADYFNVPLDYLAGKGLFAQEREIMKYRKELEHIASRYLAPELASRLGEISDIDFLLLADALFQRIEIEEDGSLRVFPKVELPNE